MQIVVVCVLLVFFTGVFVAGVRYALRRGQTWVAMAEGQFNRVEFDRKICINPGSGRFVGVNETISVAKIWFYDGTWCEALAVAEIPFPRGTKIRVLQNGYGECRVEEVKA